MISARDARKQTELNKRTEFDEHIKRMEILEKCRYTDIKIFINDQIKTSLINQVHVKINLTYSEGTEIMKRQYGTTFNELEYKNATINVGKKLASELRKEGHTVDLAYNDTWVLNGQIHIP